MLWQTLPVLDAATLEPTLRCVAHCTAYIDTPVPLELPAARSKDELMRLVMQEVSVDSSHKASNAGKAVNAKSKAMLNAGTAVTPSQVVIVQGETGCDANVVVLFGLVISKTEPGQKRT